MATEWTVLLKLGDSLISLSKAASLLVIALQITEMTLALRVHLPLGVSTHPGQLVAAIFVVAVVAHALRVVLPLWMRAGGISSDGPVSGRCRDQRKMRGVNFWAVWENIWEEEGVKFWDFSLKRPQKWEHPGEDAVLDRGSWVASFGVLSLHLWPQIAQSFAYSKKSWLG